MKVTKQLDDVLEILRKHENRLTEQEKAVAFVNNVVYSFEGLEEKLRKIDDIGEVLRQHEKMSNLLKELFLGNELEEKHKV